MESCAAVDEAGALVAQMVALDRCLSVRDFCRSAVVRSDCRPHRLRAELFARAAVDAEDLELFERVCLGWVRHHRECTNTVHTAACELLRSGRAPLATLSVTGRCLAVEAALTRAYLAGHGERCLRLYRGLHKLPDECYAGTRKGALCVRRNACESHTTSLLVARSFGPAILVDKVAVARVLMCHRTNTVFLPHEEEYVVAAVSIDAALQPHQYGHLRRRAVHLLLLNARLYQQQQQSNEQPSAPNVQQPQSQRAKKKKDRKNRKPHKHAQQQEDECWWSIEPRRAHSPPSQAPSNESPVICDVYE